MSAPNWSQPLPRPIIIPQVMKVATLDDVRRLVDKHLPAEYRSKFAWRKLAALLRRAAQGKDEAKSRANWFARTDYRRSANLKCRPRWHLCRLARQEPWPRRNGPRASLRAFPTYSKGSLTLTLSFPKMSSSLTANDWNQALNLPTHARRSKACHTAHHHRPPHLRECNARFTCRRRAGTIGFALPRSRRCRNRRRLDQIYWTL